MQLVGGCGFAAAGNACYADEVGVVLTEVSGEALYLIELLQGYNN